MSRVITPGKPATPVIPHWSPVAGTVTAVAAIWTAVIVASVFSPDLVHGSEQEHLPIAAITWWFWGLIATAFALVPIAVQRREGAVRDGLWFVLAAATGAIWLVATLLSVFTERHVTGADPTQFPVAAVFAPIVAMVATGFVAAFVTVLVRRE
jgi:hypothetical protein